MSETNNDATVVDLLRRLTDQGSHLAQQQVALVRAEVSESVDGLKLAVGAMLGAAVVAIAGLGVLLMALAYLLAENTDLSVGLSTLIVGLATMLLAFILYKSGAKKMSATELAPHRTQDTLGRTPQAATGNL